MAMNVNGEGAMVFEITTQVGVAGVKVHVMDEGIPFMTFGKVYLTISPTLTV